jgi:hypothetical protein
MKVTMRVQISGLRDGVDWPAPGETVDLPDDEAAELIARGQAATPKEIKAEEKAEAATVAADETAVAPAKTRSQR